MERCSKCGSKRVARPTPSNTLLKGPRGRRSTCAYRLLIAMMDQSIKIRWSAKHRGVENSIRYTTVTHDHLCGYRPRRKFSAKRKSSRPPPSHHCCLFASSEPRGLYLALRWNGCASQTKSPYYTVPACYLGARPSVKRWTVGPRPNVNSPRL
jgi:hypothetical protein